MTRNHPYSGLSGSLPFIGRVFQGRTVRRLTERAKAGDVNAVQRLVGILTEDPKEDLQIIVQEALSSLTHPSAIDVLCQNVLEIECPALEEIARRQEYIPSDEGSQALYLICIDRWEECELPTGDSIYRMLRNAYIRAPDAVKRRVREKIRQNGWIHLLYNDLLVCPFESVKPDLGGQIWDEIVRALQDEDRDEDLWSLLFCVPPLHSFRILRELRKKGWNPSSPCDRSLWDDMINRQNILSTFRPPVKAIWRESPHGDLTRLSLLGVGNLLAGGNQSGWISYWVLPEGRFLAGCPMHTDCVNQLTASSDGAMLASGDRTGRVCLSRSGDRALLRTWSCRTGVRFLRFTPDGCHLVCIDAHGDVMIWDIRTGTIRKKFETHQERMVWVELVEGPEEALYLITGGDAGIRLFDLPGGALKSDLNYRTKRSTAFGLSGDGTTLLVGFSDSTIRLHRIPDLHPIQTLQGCGTEVTALSEAAEGTILAAGSADGTICLWDLSAGSLRTTIRSHAGAIYQLKSLFQSSKLASGSDDGTVRLWHLPDGSPSGTFQDPEHHICSFMVTSDESILITQGTNQETRFWSLADSRPYGTLKNLPDTISALAISADEDLLVASGEDRILYVRTPGDGNLVKTIATDAGRIASLAFLPEGRYLACGGDDRMIHLWDIQTGDRIQTLQGSKGTISAIAINPNGTRIAGGGWDEVVRLWNPGDGSLLAELRGHSSVIRALCFSPDGTILASTGNDSSIILWNPHTGETVLRLPGHRGVVSCLTFTPDGQFLLSGGWDRKICIWNPKTGVRCGVLEGHSEKITQITLSQDGSIVIAGCQDGTIHFWSLYDGTLALTLWGHNGAVTALVSAGDRMISGGDDGSIKSWSLPWVKPLALATPQDLSSVRSMSTDTVLTAEASRSGALLEALIRGKVRCDIDTESITCPLGEYDIEIATEGP
jgi:WD40 repeat protein